MLQRLFFPFTPLWILACILSGVLICVSPAASETAADAPPTLSAFASSGEELLKKASQILAAQSAFSFDLELSTESNIPFPGLESQPPRRLFIALERPNRLLARLLDGPTSGTVVSDGQRLRFWVGPFPGRYQDEPAPADFGLIFPRVVTLAGGRNSTLLAALLANPPLMLLVPSGAKPLLHDNERAGEALCRKVELELGAESTLCLWLDATTNLPRQLVLDAGGSFKRPVGEVPFDLEHPVLILREKVSHWRLGPMDAGAFSFELPDGAVCVERITLSDTDDTTGGLVGKPAPEFQALKVPQGLYRSGDDSGRKLLVFVPPGGVPARELARAAAGLAASGKGPVLLIAEGTLKDLGFLANDPILAKTESLQILADAQGLVTLLYEAHGSPAAVVAIDAEGRVAWRLDGDPLELIDTLVAKTREW